jgi:hypothetical protein
MLPDLHAAIRSLLHERGNIPPREVDVRFEAPTREWVASLIRPTVSVFLYDVLENLELRHTNFQTRFEGSRAYSKADPRLFDFRFMVSVISSEVEDEHALFWRGLRVLLKHGQMPGELLPDELRRAAEGTGVLCRLDQPSESSSKLTDIWSALEVAPRPSLSYVVTLPVDVEEVFEAPLVLTRAARYRLNLGAGALELGFHIGGAVRDEAGVPAPGVAVGLEGSTQEIVTDQEGRFVFRSVPRGPATLRVSAGAGKPKLQRIEIPSDSYDVTLG